MAESNKNPKPRVRRKTVPKKKGAVEAETIVKTTDAAEPVAKAGSKGKTPLKKKGAAKKVTVKREKATPKGRATGRSKAKTRKATKGKASTESKEVVATVLEPEMDDESISFEWGRQKLEVELDRTQKELDHLRAAMYSEVDVDPEEGDVEVSERLKNVTLIAMLEKRETALREALSAILAGSYGTCNRCKKSIGKARLEARPDAKFCVKCQEEIERAARRMA